MKGQIFIADVLASLLIVTIIVAYTTWELEQVYSRSSNINYEKISTLAGDISQLAVRNILANKSEAADILPNWINATRWSLLANNMSEMVKPPYAYEASISGTSLSASGNGGCSLRKNVAISRRPVYIDRQPQTLSIKVCI